MHLGRRISRYLYFMAVFISKGCCCWYVVILAMFGSCTAVRQGHLSVCLCLTTPYIHVGHMLLQTCCSLRQVFKNMKIPQIRDPSLPLLDELSESYDNQSMHKLYVDVFLISPPSPLSLCLEYGVCMVFRKGSLTLI